MHAILLRQAYEAVSKTGGGSSLAGLTAPELAYQAKPKAEKKRGATIGAAPQLSAEGLLTAAREREVQAARV